jgi:hypothetical protein
MAAYDKIDATAAIMRALDAHVAGGLIRGWRPAPAAFATVDLVDGESGYLLRSAREASVFVHGLASAHHARLRQAAPPEPDPEPRPEVLAGAALLDGHYGPGWPARVDPALLPADGPSSVTGQLCTAAELAAMPPALRTAGDRHAAACNALGAPDGGPYRNGGRDCPRGDWLRAHGLAVHAGGGETTGRLAAEWARLIRDRQAPTEED